MLHDVYSYGQQVIFTNGDGRKTERWHPAVGTIGFVSAKNDNSSEYTVRILWPKGAVHPISESQHPNGIDTLKSKIAPYYPNSDELDKMFSEYEEVMIYDG